MWLHPVGQLEPASEYPGAGEILTRVEPMVFEATPAAGVPADRLESLEVLPVLPAAVPFGVLSSDFDHAQTLLGVGERFLVGLQPRVTDGGWVTTRVFVTTETGEVAVVGHCGSFLSARLARLAAAQDSTALDYLLQTPAEVIEQAHLRLPV